MPTRFERETQRRAERDAQRIANAKRKRVRKTKSSQIPTRNERIIESGYDAYAREEGHYDLPGE